MRSSLYKFNISKIIFNKSDFTRPVIVMIGRRDTGKSVLVRDLLFFHQDIPVGTVIPVTVSGNACYSDLVLKLFIHDNYNSNMVDKILKRQ